ncbi:response regulator transcription factor [Pontibacter roseus]|uniref:response regulator transcription factor n=1 Tax=Pontibacter roseus TaxID=336989 RepID=UPI000370B2FE|nr:response regulator transcription factor [Pontibacter roseus]
MIDVIITDDHTIIRDGVKALLNGHPSIRIVGEAANGDQLLNLLATVHADVVLMDIGLPGKDGFELTREIVEQYPNVKVLVLSVLDDISHVKRMMEIGASGYMLKTVSRDELCHGLLLVASGSRYICSDIALHLLRKVQSYNLAQPVLQPTAEQQRELSKRELEVLALIGEGFTNAEIAERLFTSKRTVETHRQNLLEKTSSRNTAMLVRYALQRGLINS